MRNTQRSTPDLDGMTLRFAGLLAAAALASSACTSDPVSTPAASTPTTTTTQVVTTKIATPTSTTSSDRSGLLVQVNDAAEAAGVKTPYLFNSVGAFVLTACDMLDDTAVDERQDVMWAFVMEFAPDADDALALGVPIACPKYVPLANKLRP